MYWLLSLFFTKKVFKIYSQLNWVHRSHNTGSLYVYQFNRFDETNQRQRYMPEKCYENLVSFYLNPRCVNSHELKIANQHIENLIHCSRRFPYKTQY